MVISAEGYNDAEVLVPRAADLTAIKGLIVRLDLKTEQAAPAAPETIIGKVTRDGQPVKSAGWPSGRSASRPAPPMRRSCTGEW